MSQKGIRRCAILCIVTLCLVGLLPAGAQGERGEFTDVTKDYWGYDSIVWATEQDIVDGYPDGTFKPEQSVTQTEFIAMLVRAYLDKDKLPDENGGYWGEPYFQYAFNMGWGGSIIVPPSSKLSDNSMSPKYNVLMARMYVAKIITNANGRNYNFDDSIRFLLDSGLAEGKTDSSIEGFKGHDLLSRAEAVTFIKNLKAKQDMLYPSPIHGNSYDPATLQLSPFETFPLVVEQPSNDSLIRYSQVDFASPTAGYNLVRRPSYTISGTVAQAIGKDLFITVEYWDSSIFNPVTTVEIPIKDGQFSTDIELPKSGVYRVMVASEYETEGKTYDQKMTLTSFYVDYKID
ncbi:S-layer homology domain-containing protein [Paenibacillus sp. J2TS4]|uniref:S-layer homology domain-containing protein n=1 Tax=Paenibacillus sp. J2TS4 TaxID=2807194 RepID=UPI001B17598F|nr:S-layer homology domain-containing protein [Paenibacillus sp. J2TS4]GIP35173.1 hypothetical protein J2TS4_43830 [Paenibacillus sp. J2TS4]